MKGLKSIFSSFSVLCSVCIVFALMTGLCYSAAAERIAENEENRIKALRMELLPGAESFSKLEDSGLLQDVLSVWKADNGKGWIIEVSSRGYKSDITVMTGVSIEGRITGVRVTDTGEETPGIATRITQPAYLNQYTGASGISSSKSGGLSAYIETVSGATASSRAVFSCVSTALLQAAELGGERE